MERADLELKLNNAIGGRSQNLHLLRFIAAVSVIFGHAFPISMGASYSDCLSTLTKGQMNFGEVAVSVFFLVGGFLIAKSAERLETGKAYFKARCLRIFPPLFFVIFSTVFLGAFFTSEIPKQYFTNTATWKYLLNCFFILVHNLPGVFTNNPYLPTVNGSLWTLPVEFLCYVACFFVLQAKWFDQKRFVLTIPLVVAGLGLGNVAASRIPLVGSAIRPCLLFYIGMGYYIYRDHIKLRKTWFIIAVGGMALSVMFKASIFGWIVFFPYIVFSLCFGIKQVPSKLGKLGNYSYGIYLWGFPVQQAVVHCMTGGKQMNPYVNFTIALPIAFFLGWLTYNIAEKPFAQGNLQRLLNNYDKMCARDKR